MSLGSKCKIKKKGLFNNYGQDYIGIIDTNTFDKIYYQSNARKDILSLKAQKPSIFKR
jgi:hypothetical protein